MEPHGNVSWRRSQAVSKIPTVRKMDALLDHDAGIEYGEPPLLSPPQDEHAVYHPSPEHQGLQPGEQKFERQETALTKKFSPGFTAKSA